MGLDMHLTGKKYLYHDWDNPENDQKQDGFRVQGVDLELGYWRKVPDLHGFIVREFQEGKDERQETDLSADDLRKILAAVEADALPHTEGFFFGKQKAADKAPTVKILKAAIKWLEIEEKGVSRSVVYQVSW